MTGEIGRTPDDWMSVSGGPFNWFVTKENTWLVRPTSLPKEVTDPYNLTPEQLEKLENPSEHKREYNSIVTKESFVDFYLSLYFRCPDARDVFFLPHDDNEKLSWVRGARNWGNSGVKIFSNEGDGNEVQIMDSCLDNPDVLDNDNINLNSGLNGCSPVCSGYVPIGQLCGGLYMHIAPKADAVLEAEGWPTPEGEWNKLEIFFRARRLNKDNSTKEKAEITVLLNDVETVRADLDYSFTKGITPVEGNVWAECGRIYLQEHDNMVEYKDIKILSVEE